MRSRIEGEFLQNASRVDNLIAAYRDLEANNIGNIQARKDVLRAAIVLMHSTLEEIIRNLYVWLLPNGSKENLNKIPFSGHEANNRAKGFLLGDLKEFEGKFVENIIIESIEKYVDTMNLNNTTQLSNSFEIVSISIVTLRDYFPKLDSIMKRRHQIVHQMDRDNDLDPLTFPISDITLETVVEWQDTLQKFFTDLLKLLPRQV